MMAFVISYSKKHGIDYVVPKQVVNPHIAGRGAYIFPGVVYADNIEPLEVYKESAFYYQEIPPMDNVCFHGSFQSQKYFNEYKDDVLRAFGFQWRMKNGYCSIHVRRGDYINWADWHPPVSPEYLYKAVEYVVSKAPQIKFRVFSDGIDWCKEIFSLPGFNEHYFEYSEGRTEIEDLEGISFCEHNIGSNSSFSIWGDYLNQNPNKMSFFPKDWFGPKFDHNTKDLYPPNAIIL